MYKQSYKELYHGTSTSNFESIKNNGFNFSTHGWCGKGIYFYDVKSKAWWSAARTCYELKKITAKKHIPGIIKVSINDIDKCCVLDLRDYKQGMLFQEFVTNTCAAYQLANNESSTAPSYTDMLKLRAAIIEFYSMENDIHMVIGVFKQPRNNDENEFFTGFDMVTGIETIYCVKNTEHMTIDDYIYKRRGCNGLG